MGKQNYVWLNGYFFPDSEPVIDLRNRSFAYGDGIFETIHAFGTQGKHLHLHYARLIKSMKLLELDIPSYLTHEFLDREITRLLNKNRLFQSTRVRITVFRNPGGFYTPTTQSIGMAMQSIQLIPNFFPINQKGLVVDLYTTNRKPINMLSSVKSCNALLYVLAGIQKERIGVDDCLLINDQNRIVEAISSNLFVVVGNQIFTPSLDEGCVAGVMRQVVIGLANDLGYKVFHNGQIDTDMLTKADELFLTNAVAGIKWVVALRHKRYYSAVARKISHQLNHSTFGNQFSEGFSG